MDKTSKYAIATLIAAAAIIGVIVAAVAGPYTKAYAVTFTTGCSGNMHDVAPNGNPHDNGENGNPHDVNNLEPTDEASGCPGTK